MQTAYCPIFAGVLLQLFDVFMASQPVVSVRDVSHYFGAGTLRTQVLCGVSADIWPGELVTVMGPSGSGKTTLLNLVGGLRRGIQMLAEHARAPQTLHEDTATAEHS